MGCCCPTALATPSLSQEVIENVRGLVSSGVPLFGICLGHQLLGLGVGGQTFKLKFGHHGGNQPVKDLSTGRVLITSQNHGFAVDPDSLPDNCRVSQVNLNDGTVEAFVVENRPGAFGPVSSRGRAWTPRRSRAFRQLPADGGRESS